MDIKIFLYDNDNIELYAEHSSRFITSYQEKESYFDELSQYKIHKMDYDEKNKTLRIIGKNNLTFYSFDKLVSKPFFDSMRKRIELYNRRSVNKKKTLVRKSIAVGLTTITLGTLIKSNINFGSKQKILEIESVPLVEDEMLLLDDEKDDVVYISDVTPIKLTEGPVYELTNQQEESVEQIESNNEQLVQINNFNSFSELENASYEKTIEFASKMYNIEYDVAKQVISDNKEYIVGPKGEVSYWMDSNKELDRVKDLNEIGIINADTTKAGIFITLKNYAYDNNTLSGDIIESKKTPQDKEQDIIDIARYIYGVESHEILTTILAVHRLETGRGTSQICLNKNNLGGNRNPDLTFTQYKTSEIGAESMVRNFLNNYNRAFYNEKSSPNNSIIQNIALSYCETPEAWASDVKGLANEIKINNELSKYIISNNYTY